MFLISLFILCILTALPSWGQSLSQECLSSSLVFTPGSSLNTTIAVFGETCFATLVYPGQSTSTMFKVIPPSMACGNDIPFQEISIMSDTPPGQAMLTVTCAETFTSTCYVVTVLPLPKSARVRRQMAASSPPSNTIQGFCSNEANLAPVIPGALPGVTTIASVPSAAGGSTAATGTTANTQQTAATGTTANTQQTAATGMTANTQQTAASGMTANTQQTTGPMANTGQPASTGDATAVLGGATGASNAGPGPSTCAC
jgi:hypothetical protein